MKNNIRRAPIKIVLEIYDENYSAFLKDLYFWAHSKERMMQSKREINNNQLWTTVEELVSWDFFLNLFNNKYSYPRVFSLNK